MKKIANKILNYLGKEDCIRLGIFIGIFFVNSLLIFGEGGTGYVNQVIDWVATAFKVTGAGIGMTGAGQMAFGYLGDNPTAVAAAWKKLAAGGMLLVIGTAGPAAFKA